MGQTSASLLPIFSQDPRDEGFVQDPYPAYERARKLGSLWYWAQYERAVSGDYALVDAVLRDRDWVREVPAHLGGETPDHLRAFRAVERFSLLELEPPVHTRIRKAVLKAFTPASINALEPVIEQICAEAIAAFPAGQFDLLDAYGALVPVRVIAHILGVDPLMAPQLLAWSHDMVAMYQARRDRGIEDAANTAATDFAAFIKGEIAAKRARPCDDLLSRLANAPRADRLSDDEMVSTTILLLNAGHEATVHTIGNGVRLLAGMDRPAQYFASAEAAASACNEILRFDPPLHMFERYAAKRIELAGHVFEAGDTLGLLLAGANRDPAVFKGADEFRPDRGMVPMTSLGAGVHFCLGAPLARLELAIALRVLFERCPGLNAQPARFADRYHFHGLEALMVAV